MTDMTDMTDMIPLGFVDGTVLHLESPEMPMRVGSPAQMPPKARRTRRSAVTARAT